METRRLSPDEIWIEAPFERHTGLLLWHAMAQCGLRKGVIDWREGEEQALVEGRSPSDFSSPEAIFQARLRPDQNGTRVAFSSIRPDKQFDFGNNTGVRRRLSARIEKLLGQFPITERLPEPSSAPIPAPIASPIGGEKLVMRNEAQHRNLLPLQPAPLWQQVAPFVYVVFGIGTMVFPGVSTLFCLGFAVWLWSGRTRRQQHKTTPFMFLALGLWGCYQLFARYF